MTDAPGRLTENAPLPDALVEKYAAKGSHLVRCDQPLKWAGRAKIVEADFACETLLDRGKIRHEPTSLAAGIRGLIELGRP